MFNAEKGDGGVQDRLKKKNATNTTTQNITKKANNKHRQGKTIQFSRWKSWTVKTMERPSETKKHSKKQNARRRSRRGNKGLKFVILKEEQQND